MTTFLALLALGLLLRLGLRWTFSELLRQRAYMLRVKARRARAVEDAHWQVFRQSEAELAMTLWRRGFVGRMTESMRDVNEAMQVFVVSFASVSEQAHHLRMLLGYREILKGLE